MQRGSTTAQAVDRVRTQLSVARNAVAELQSARSVIRQQMDEGAVTAPAAGRILSMPTRLGEVVLAGEPIATIAGGSVFLRLAIPERHAGDLAVGDRIAIGEGETEREGRIEKIYPLIEGGRITVDAAVEGLSDSFIGQRIRVQVPVGVRQALAVPEAAIRRSAGLDLVQICAEGRTVAVVPGARIDTAEGPMVEILSGLRSGDTVVLP